MEVSAVFLDQNIPIPFPVQDEPDHTDRRNHPAMVLREVVLATDVVECESDVEFEEYHLLRLDKLNPLRLFEEASAVAAFAARQQETTTGQTKQNYGDLGKLAMTLVELYRPPRPSPRRRGTNNPYRHSNDRGTNLSYQPSAMRLRSGRGR